LGLITARDVSERRWAQAQLEQKEAEQRRLLESLAAYVWSADLDEGGNWRYRYYSPEAEKVTGRPAQFFLADPERWFDVVHPDDREGLHATFARARSGRLAGTEDEYRIVRPDGAVRWIRDVIAYTWGPEGVTARLDGLVTDVTTRRQAEETVRSREATYRVLVENLEQYVFLKDVGLRFLAAN